MHKREQNAFHFIEPRMTALFDIAFVANAAILFDFFYL